MKEALVAILTANAGVTALAVDRIFPMIIPQETFDNASRKPCVVYRLTGVERSQTLCGTSPTMQSVFAIDCYAKTYAAAASLADAVRAALLDYRGVAAGVSIANARLDTEFDLLDIEPGLHRVSMQFSIWHEAP